MNRRLLDYGESGLLVECRDLDDALALRAGLDREPMAEIVETVPGARTLLLRLDSALSPARRELLLTIAGTAPDTPDQAVLRIEVDYSGPDLDEVAQLTGLTPAEVVAAHTGQLWTVGFCGFAPGFAYLRATDDRLRVPRRQSPRTRVPSGAVGLADEWSGIYPRAGPGGWQLIGRTERVLWDLDASPPALLQPGISVQFIATVPSPPRPTTAGQGLSPSRVPRRR